MISPRHQFRGLLSTCIDGIGNGRVLRASNDNIARINNATRRVTMFHRPSSGRATIFYRLDDRANRPDRPATTKFPSYRTEWKRCVHQHAPQSTNAFSTFTKSEYVHPLSQIVLEHLQSRHGQWVTEMGLDTGLELNKDGSFVLRFPIADCEIDGVAAEDGGGPGEDETSVDRGSIWTTFEPTERAHYLCVTKGSLVGRYMLQDNTKSAWHLEKKSTPERVQDAVDNMIEKLQESRVDVS